VPPAQSSPVTSFAPALLAWFDHSGRKDLPWQRDTTPYRVWVSEIMLQQTQVTTVIPYYERFMARFADVAALAAAPIDEVLHLWTGLGYYARARNLHRAAQIIVTEHAGELPATIEAMQALPGIGRSTAGAVLALSRAQRHPILDGNVKRVLTRYFGIAGFPGEPKVERELWRLAEACTPANRVANYTQAIMDLGATVCVRSHPRCNVCPMAEHCVARIEGRQTMLPTPRPRKVRPQRSAFVVIARNAAGAVLLERRPAAGLWGGLWTLPQFETRDAASQWIGTRRPTDDRDVDAGIDETLAIYHHAFTHFDLALHPLQIRIDHAFAAEDDAWMWYDPAQPARVGLAKPAVDLIARTREPASSRNGDLFR
jgi:A/G-specific adenine glycosylase